MTRPWKPRTLEAVRTDIEVFEDLRAYRPLTPRGHFHKLAAKRVIESAQPAGWAAEDGLKGAAEDLREGRQ